MLHRRLPSSESSNNLTLHTEIVCRKILLPWETRVRVPFCLFTWKFPKHYLWVSNAQTCFKPHHIFCQSSQVTMSPRFDFLECALLQIQEQAWNCQSSGKNTPKIGTCAALESRSHCSSAFRPGPSVLSRSPNLLLFLLSSAGSSLSLAFQILRRMCNCFPSLPWNFIIYLTKHRNAGIPGQTLLLDDVCPLGSFKF